MQNYGVILTIATIIGLPGDTPQISHLV